MFIKVLTRFFSRHKSWIIIGMFETKKKMLGNIGYEEQKILNIGLGKCWYPRKKLI
jgi:hypothetical protein